jgi:hypothetical protein
MYKYVLKKKNEYYAKHPLIIKHVSRVYNEIDLILKRQKRAFRRFLQHP